MRLPRCRPLALLTWSTNNRNRQKYVERMTVGAPHISVWKNKMLPPSVFLTCGTHDIVSLYSQYTREQHKIGWHLGHSCSSSIFFVIVEMEQGLNWVVARLAQAYILCSPCDQPSYFLFVKISPIYFFWRIPNPGLLIFLRPNGLQLFQESNMKWVVNIKTDEKLAITL